MARRSRNDPAARELRALAPLLERTAVPEPSTELVHRALREARSELARSQQVAPVRAERPELPAGFGRELVRVLAAAALPFAFVFALDLAIVRNAPAMLSRLLPEGLALTVVGVYAIGCLGLLGFALGSLPFAAHRRASVRDRVRQVRAGSGR